MSVRQAKARFSQLVREASAGYEVTVTSHGEPRARLVPVRRRPRRFKVDRKRLAGARAGKRGTPAEQIVRRDRDGRG